MTHTYVSMYNQHNLQAYVQPSMLESLAKTKLKDLWFIFAGKVIWVLGNQINSQIYSEDF